MTYQRSHAVSPSFDVGLLIVDVAVAVGGVRAGLGARSGATGRIRSAIESVRGQDHARARAAAVAGRSQRWGTPQRGSSSLRGSTHAPRALLGGLVCALVVGVLAAVVAARY